MCRADDPDANADREALLHRLRERVSRDENDEETAENAGDETGEPGVRSVSMPLGGANGWLEKAGKDMIAWLCFGAYKVRLHTHTHTRTHTHTHTHTHSAASCMCSLYQRSVVLSAYILPFAVRAVFPPTRRVWTRNAQPCDTHVCYVCMLRDVSWSDAGLRQGGAARSRMSSLLPACSAVCHVF